VPLTTVHFQRLVQDSQEYGSNDEHMVSRVFFALEVDGTVAPNLYVDIKQTVGSSFETAPIEVSKPVGYKGPFDHSAFSSIVEKYYRSQVGATGSGIRISGGGNIRMRNNLFIQPATEVARRICTQR
jgi:hypothetical protein